MKTLSFFHFIFIALLLFSPNWHSTAYAEKKQSNVKSVKKVKKVNKAKKVKKGKKRRAKRRSKKKLSLRAPSRIRSSYAGSGGTFFRYRLNTILGVNIIQGNSGFVNGVQFGFAVKKGLPLYIGPEFTFALYSPGSTIATLVGGWYQLRIARSPRLSLGIGLIAGPAFSSDFSVLRSVSLANFFETILSQEISDLVSVRVQLRPGFLNGIFSFMMNLNASFRFA